MSFNGQKNNRPEFSNLQFTDVIRSWNVSGGNFRPEMVMSKSLIGKFVCALEDQIGVSFLWRQSNDAEEISSALFFKYVDFIQDIDDLYPSFAQLFLQLGVMDNIVSTENS